MATVTEISRSQFGQAASKVTGIGGGVATFALLWAKHHSAEVYVTSSSDEKIAAAKTLGAVDGVNIGPSGWGFLDVARMAQAAGIDAPAAQGSFNTTNVSNGFGNLLSRAISNVNSAQQESAMMARQIETGDGGASLVKAMIASQKANISFQAAILH